MGIVILKLGGGIITYKHQSSPKARINLIKIIARELAYLYKRKTHLKLILLCGAGSFGHPLVYKHKLVNRRLTSSSLVPAGEVINNVCKLGSLISKACLNIGLPVIPLQTSSLFEIKNEKVAIKSFSTIETVLKFGGIPLFGGDIVIDKEGRVNVVSADELAVLLAKHFKNSKVLFATDVDGVYKSFPPRKGEQPLQRIGRKELQSLIANDFLLNIAQKYDVTGGMAGKLKKILKLRSRKVIIFNGQKYSLLRKALLDKKVEGTTIFL